jgi:hypothetical protein
MLSLCDFTNGGLKPQQQQPQQVQSYGWSSSSSTYPSSASSSSSSSSSRLTGWLCFTAACAYMATGMSGLAQYALPTNPGEAFKMADVAQRHKVWDYWGYGDLTMRI